MAAVAGGQGAARGRRVGSGARCCRGMSSLHPPLRGGCGSPDGGVGCGWEDLFGSFGPRPPRLALRRTAPVAPHWPQFPPGLNHFFGWGACGTPSGAVCT